MNDHNRQQPWTTANANTHPTSTLHWGMWLYARLWMMRPWPSNQTQPPCVWNEARRQQRRGPRWVPLLGAPTAQHWPPSWTPGQVPMVNMNPVPMRPPVSHLPLSLSLLPTLNSYTANVPTETQPECRCTPTHLPPFTNAHWHCWGWCLFSWKTYISKHEKGLFAGKTDSVSQTNKRKTDITPSSVSQARWVWPGNVATHAHIDSQHTTTSQTPITPPNITNTTTNTSQTETWRHARPHKPKKKCGTTTPPLPQCPMWTWMRRLPAVSTTGTWAPLSESFHSLVIYSLHVLFTTNWSFFFLLYFT